MSAVICAERQGRQLNNNKCFSGYLAAARQLPAPGLFWEFTSRRHGPSPMQVQHGLDVCGRRLGFAVSDGVR